MRRHSLAAQAGLESGRRERLLDRIAADSDFRLRRRRRSMPLDRPARLHRPLRRSRCDEFLAEVVEPALRGLDGGLLRVEAPRI